VAAEDVLPFVRDTCSGGVCTVVEQRSVTEDPQVTVCSVADFLYDPPAEPRDAPRQDQFFQHGTEVTVVIECPPPSTDTSSGESSGSESSSSSSSSSSASSSSSGG
jgi:hypothetical protein